jgi:hypothetical protein
MLSAKIVGEDIDLYRLDAQERRRCLRFAETRMRSNWYETPILHTV